MRILIECGDIVMIPDDDHDIFNCGILSEKFRGSRTEYVTERPYTVPGGVVSPDGSQVNFKNPEPVSRFQRLVIPFNLFMQIILEAR